MRALLMILISLGVLAGCASRNAEQMRHDGVESRVLYRQAQHRESVPTALDVRRVKHMMIRDVQYEPYTRTAMNELDVQFKRLPNPMITIYVYQHLATADNAPIPGYTTAISLYSRDQYALPNEVLAQQASGSREP